MGNRRKYFEDSLSFIRITPRPAGYTKWYIDTSIKVSIIVLMIWDIRVCPQNRSPYFSVYLNGQRGTAVVNSASSPTGAAGSVRSVFVFDKYIVKVGSIGEAYLDIKPWDEHFFAKVVLVDVNKQWLIQERINCVPNQRADEDDWESVMEMAQKYDIGDVCFQYNTLGEERKAHNWTVDINGQPIIFDYDYRGFDEWQELSFME